MKIPEFQKYLKICVIKIDTCDATIGKMQLFTVYRYGHTFVSKRSAAKLSHTTKKKKKDKKILNDMHRIYRKIMATFINIKLYCIYDCKFKTYGSKFKNNFNNTNRYIL